MDSYFIFQTIGLIVASAITGAVIVPHAWAKVKAMCTRVQVPAPTPIDATTTPTTTSVPSIAMSLDDETCQRSDVIPMHNSGYFTIGQLNKYLKRKPVTLPHDVERVVTDLTKTVSLRVGASDDIKTPKDPVSAKIQNMLKGLREQLLVDGPIRSIVQKRCEEEANKRRVEQGKVQLPTRVTETLPESVNTVKLESCENLIKETDLFTFRSPGYDATSQEHMLRLASMLIPVVAKRAADQSRSRTAHIDYNYDINDVKLVDPVVDAEQREAEQRRREAEWSAANRFVIAGPAPPQLAEVSQQ